MIPLKTIELRAGHRVDMLTGLATVESATADIGGGYTVGLQYSDGTVHAVRNVEANVVWHVEL